MFKSETDKQFVASKTVSVFPEVQSNFGPKNNNVVRWFVPPSIGFYDPRYTKLKYDLQMEGRGINRPDPRCGVHALWRDLRIRDGNGITELEFIQDYNALTSTWWHYTSNPSIDDSRDMFQGRSQNKSIDQQLYYAPTPDWSAGATDESPAKLKIQIDQPIYSGVLGGDKIFPIVATQGLRFEMFLDQMQRSLTQNTVDGEEAFFMEIETPILGATGGTAQARQEKATIDAEFSCVVEDPNASTTGRGVNINASPVNNNPFDISDPLYIDLAGGGSEKSLGVISGFTKDGAGRLVIQFIPDRAIGASLGTDYPQGSKIYYKVKDRVDGKVVANVPEAQITGASTKISYTISDMQMLMLQVQPPTGYVEQMMKQVMGSGLTLDYRTSQLYRFNLATLNGLTSQLIPSTETRAYSILSLPLDQSRQNDITTSAFRGQRDGSVNYQYSLGSVLVPDRPIELERLTQTPPRAEMLALIELEKSLMNADKPVRNLLRPADNFLIGRSFSKYGQVSNIADETLTLRVQYSGATVQKMFEHFIYYLKRIKISNDGVMVV